MKDPWKKMFTLNYILTDYYIITEPKKKNTFKLYFYY